MTFKEVPKLGRCPLCGSELHRLWGEGWDWDRAICSNRDCVYDAELDVMTCTEPDGSVIQIAKPKDEE